MKQEVQKVNKMPDTLAPFFGRLLITGIFISRTVKRLAFEHNSSLRLKKGSEGASAITSIALLLESVSGLSLIFWLFTRVGIYVLMIFFLPATLIFQSFWQY
jgi:putative oxidoreductase